MVRLYSECCCSMDQQACSSDCDDCDAQHQCPPCHCDQQSITSQPTTKKTPLETSDLHRRTTTNNTDHAPQQHLGLTSSVAPRQHDPSPPHDRHHKTKRLRSEDRERQHFLMERKNRRLAATTVDDAPPPAYRAAKRQSSAVSGDETRKSAVDRELSQASVVEREFEDSKKAHAGLFKQLSCFVRQNKKK